MQISCFAVSYYPVSNFLIGFPFAHLAPEDFEAPARPTSPAYSERLWISPPDVPSDGSTLVARVHWADGTSDTWHAECRYEPVEEYAANIARVFTEYPSKVRSVECLIIL